MAAFRGAAAAVAIAIVTALSVGVQGAAASTPPKADFFGGSACAPEFCFGIRAKVGEPVILDASSSTDSDGTIVKYEWDMDGNGTYERDGGSAKTTSGTYYKASTGTDDFKIGLRVTDNSGDTGVVAIRLVVFQADCQKTLNIGRMTATGACLRKISAATHESAETIVVNGIRVVPQGGNKIRIFNHVFGKTVSIDAGKAQVYVRSNGKKVVLRDGQALHLKVVKGQDLKGLKFSKFNGLKVSGLSNPIKLNADKVSSELSFYLALPASMGSATGKKINLTPGKGNMAAIRSCPEATSGFCFEVPEALMYGIPLKKLIVSYNADGLWEIAAGIELPAPLGGQLNAGFGLNTAKGSFYGDIAYDPADPGLGPFGPGIYIQRINFSIAIKPNPQTNSDIKKCVPYIGEVPFDIEKALNDILVAGGYPKINMPPDASPIYIDYGTPDLALCGGIKMSLGPEILGASALALDGGLGFATYPDRPARLNAFGQLSVVGIPLANARFEAHTDGYVYTIADIGHSFAGIVSFKGFIQLEMRLPKFNAQAYVKVCVDPVSLCAGAEALLSSKGVAACLEGPFGWRPGAGWVYGKDPDIIWGGCDVGPYKEKISSKSAGRPRARAAGSVIPVTIPKGLPGTAITVLGRGAPPNITLVGPKGETFTTPAGTKAVQAPRYWLIKDVKKGTTSVAMFAPTAGAWQLKVNDGSAPVVSVRQADGLPKPKFKARVLGRGYKRQLTFSTTARRGQTITFYEGGKTGRKLIGSTSKFARTFDFKPTPGKRERRPIFAYVEQDGFGRARIPVTSYTAPKAQRAGVPPQLKVRRAGKKLVITWAKARDARTYYLHVVLTDGRHLFFSTKKRKVTVPGVARNVKANVSVAGATAERLRGKAKLVKVKSVAKRR